MKSYIPPIFPDNWEDSREITSILYENGWAVIQYRIERDMFMVRYVDTSYWLELNNIESRHDKNGSDILRHCIETPLGVRAIPFEVIKEHLQKIEPK